jgi:hypothetical protein
MDQNLSAIELPSDPSNGVRCGLAVKTIDDNAVDPLTDAKTTEDKAVDALNVARLAARQPT